MYSYIKDSKVLRHEGNEILRLCRSLPRFAEHPEVTDFYERLATAAFSYCEKVEFPRLRESFCEQTRGGARLSFKPYRYDLSATVLSCDGELAEIELRVTLCEERGDNLSSYTDRQRWSLTHGMMKK